MIRSKYPMLVPNAFKRIYIYGRGGGFLHLSEDETNFLGCAGRSWVSPLEIDIFESALQARGELNCSNFEQYEQSCTCHLGHPPCSWCTSDENPLNQEEDLNQAMLDRDLAPPRPTYIGFETLIETYDLADLTKAEQLFRALNVTCALTHMPARGWLDRC